MIDWNICRHWTTKCFWPMKSILKWIGPASTLILDVRIILSARCECSFWSIECSWVELCRFFVCLMNFYWYLTYYCPYKCNTIWFLFQQRLNRNFWIGSFCSFCTVFPIYNCIPHRWHHQPRKTSSRAFGPSVKANHVSSLFILLYLDALILCIIFPWF